MYSLCVIPMVVRHAGPSWVDNLLNDILGLDDDVQNSKLGEWFKKFRLIR